MKKMIVLAAALGALLAAATPSGATHNQQGLKLCPGGTYHAPTPPKLFPFDPCYAGPAPAPAKADTAKKK